MEIVMADETPLGLVTRASLIESGVHAEEVQ